jgi:hypothetical protein
MTKRDALRELTRLSEELGLYDIPLEEILETCRRVRQEMHEEREAKKLPPEEKERFLSQGAADLLSGKISSDEWHRIQRLYGPDYLAAARVLAERRAAARKEK